MGVFLSAALLITLSLAGLHHAHHNIMRWRREARITWQQIDRLIEQRNTADDPITLAHVERKIDDVAQFHNRTVHAANREMGTLSGRLVSHMRGLRKLSPYTPAHRIPPPSQSDA
ncbi:hypothetical protein CCB81_00405 [Armatimonadetes bacterium Uphvl-Ar2]|jgi:hypothetical protein|nr:hypothetical protein CCB81_00405 [Armatimonadetes bacterium Uphvl-Ar2]